MSGMIVLYCTDNLRQFCRENQNLTHVTPKDPRLRVDPITYVEDLKVMHMHASYGQGI